MNRLELIVPLLISQRKKLNHGTQVVFTQVNEYSVILSYTRPNSFTKDTGIFITDHTELRSDYTFIEAGFSYDFEYYVFPYKVSLGKMCINRMGQTNGTFV